MSSFTKYLIGYSYVFLEIPKRKMWFKERIIFPLVVFIVCTNVKSQGDENENYLITLSDDDFEHKTQISTGMTTGDWFVLM